MKEWLEVTGERMAELDLWLWALGSPSQAEQSLPQSHQQPIDRKLTWESPTPTRTQVGFIQRWP